MRRLKDLKGAGFTLLELILVVTIMGVLTVGVSTYFGTFSRFQEDRYIADLINTMEFLHSEAEKSYQFYLISFDFERRSWQAGTLNNLSSPSPTVGGAKPSGSTATLTGPPSAPAGAGSLTVELAEFLNPPLGNAQDFAPPIDFPSLYEHHLFPGQAGFEDIVTPRGMQISSGGDNPYLIFSPRGFTEFGVLHLVRSDQTRVTLVTNPFTGLVEHYEGYREFKWQLDASGGGL
jgi:prepilin-type N-terminal cleavage/methylation domain-containing protein